MLCASVAEKLWDMHTCMGLGTDYAASSSLSTSPLFSTPPTSFEDKWRSFLTFSCTPTVWTTTKFVLTDLVWMYVCVYVFDWHEIIICVTCVRLVGRGKNYVNVRFFVSRRFNTAWVWHGGSLHYALHFHTSLGRYTFIQISLHFHTSFGDQDLMAIKSQGRRRDRTVHSLSKFLFDQVKTLYYYYLREHVQEHFFSRDFDVSLTKGDNWRVLSTDLKITG